jgi:integrase
MATETRFPFTVERIRHLECDGRSTDIRYDSSASSPCVGFGVRVYPSGTKKWVLKYREVEKVYGRRATQKPVRGKERLVVLGTFGDRPTVAGHWGERAIFSRYMTLSQARDKAREIYLEVTQEPAEESWITLNQFMPVYMAHKKSEGIAKKSLYDIERRVKKYLSEPFGTEPLREIRRSDLIVLLDGIKDGSKSISGRPAPIEHNRLLVHLSNIYRVAETLEKIPLGFAYPTRLIKKAKEKPRKLFLEDHKLKALYASLKDEKDENALYVIQILIHQGMRKEEVLGLRWCDVNLDRVPGRECEPPHLFVGEAKNGDPLFSVLSPQAISIFGHLATLRTGTGQYWYYHPVFVGRSTKKNPQISLKDIRYSWERLRIASGIPEFTIHDLRHCVGTWLDRLGYSELRIGRVLNHRIKSVTQSYSRTANTEKEKTMIDLANWIENTVGAPILRERQ